jgi:hypothetical protein
LHPQFDSTENAVMNRLRRFYVLCHADFDDSVVVNLIRKAIYCGPRVPWRGIRHVEIPRQRHLLFVEAESADHAVHCARKHVSEAGGGEPTLRVVGSPTGV